eukprot:XP_001707439.1 Hypothetical protein GL50803_39143 [Giardia lamblia ATCC 50803]
MSTRTVSKPPLIFYFCPSLCSTPLTYSSRPEMAMRIIIPKSRTFAHLCSCKRIVMYPRPGRLISIFPTNSYGSRYTLPVV